MLDFRMETFLSVCNTLNYTQSARELNLTQPAVSQHIHFLEKEYGVKLFELNGKKNTLTKAGIALRSAALTMKHDEIHLKEILQNLSGKSRSYHFGATLTVAEYMLPDSLRNILTLHPKSQITMSVNNTTTLLQQIDAGLLDFAIIEGNYSHEEYDSFLYRKEEYVACASASFVKKDKVYTLRELLCNRLITREPGSGTRDILEACLINQGYNISDFAELMEIGNINVIKELVKDNFGITFLYRAAIKKEESEKTLRVIPLSDFTLYHDIFFVFRKGSLFSDEYKDIYLDFC